MIASIVTAIFLTGVILVVIWGIGRRALESHRSFQGQSVGRCGIRKSIAWRLKKSGGIIEDPDLNLVKEWKLEEFVATMRTGTDPGGHELNEQMPWRPIGKMDDEELGAVYEYLTHLPGSQNTAAN
jgi:hypothetical protein